MYLLTQGFFSTLCVVLGVGVGSISNMIYYKLTTKEEIFSKQPRCGSCGEDLHHLDMLPIIGFLRVKGKCRYCDCDVPKQHLILEIAGGVIGGILAGVGVYYNLF